MKYGKNMHGVQATARRIRAFLKDTEHSVYVDTDNRLIDVVYGDTMPQFLRFPDLRAAGAVRTGHKGHPV